jgi:hypothetical protein
MPRATTDKRNVTADVAAPVVTGIQRQWGKRPPPPCADNQPTDVAATPERFFTEPSEGRAVDSIMRGFVRLSLLWIPAVLGLALINRRRGPC